MEIDIMELLGNDPSKVFLTNHDWTNPATHQLDQCTATGDFAGAWHVFAAEVTDQAITWYVDGAQRCQSTRGIPGTPLYLLLNTALGGSWPGNPDGTTLFPQYHDIDWVRFYGEPSWISREQIADGSFERPGAKWMSPWYFRASAPSAATVACDTTTFADGAASARVDVTATSTAAWDVQLSQGLIWVKAGRPENISFWARASSARAVQWVVQKDSAPFTEYLNRSISLTTSWQRYTASFTPTVSEHVLFTFNLAQAAVPVWIDHVSMSY
jgi:beta-glucanase (GH16 family)